MASYVFLRSSMEVSHRFDVDFLTSEPIAPIKDSAESWGQATQLPN
jgi:hypothetical protein